MPQRLFESTTSRSRSFHLLNVLRVDERKVRENAWGPLTTLPFPLVLLSVFSLVGCGRSTDMSQESSHDVEATREAGPVSEAGLNIAPLENDQLPSAQEAQASRDDVGENDAGETPVSEQAASGSPTPPVDQHSLPAAENSRGASLETSAGSDADAGMPAASEDFYRRVHAVCVGIDRYRSPAIGDLQHAEHDAQAVERVLRDRFGFSTTLLVGEDAHRDQIFEVIEQFSGDQFRDDALIFFFAGHGQTVPLTSFGREGFLIPQDAFLNLSDTRDIAQWRQRAIAMNEIADRLTDSPLRHVLLIADACYSGFFGKRGELLERADIQQLVMQPSRIAITAGTEGQPAIEDGKLGHGLFTAALLEGLKSRRPITASELFVGVRMAVAKSSGSRMLPQLREMAVGNGEFVFVPQALEPLQVRTALQRINQRLLQKVSKETTVADVIRAFEAPHYQYSTTPEQQLREWAQRTKRFEDNAALGDGLAMAALHYAYARGLGVTPDVEKALEWARLAFDSKTAAGKHVLARCYLEGLGVDKNEVAAWKLLEEAAKQGFSISKYSLAMRELSGRTSADSLRLSDDDVKRYFTAAADAGSHRALYQLAVLHMPVTEDRDAFGNLNNGRFFLGEQKDVDRAVGYLRQAAERGSDDACHSLFNWLRRGIGGLEEDHEEAIKWLTKGAELGHPISQGTLGAAQVQGSEVMVDLFGDLFTRNVTEGMRWLELAAAQGDASTLMHLAYIYSEGIEGQRPNPARARELLEKAVAMEVPDALAQQAVWYAGGIFYPKDEGKAFELLNQAAKLGSPEGHYLLGVWFEGGAGPVDNLYEYLSPAKARELQRADGLAKAMAWYVKAAEFGHPAAKERVKAFAEDVRHWTEIAESGRYSAHWGEKKHTVRVYDSIKTHSPEAYKYLEQIVGNPLDEGETDE